MKTGSVQVSVAGWCQQCMEPSGIWFPRWVISIPNTETPVWVLSKGKCVPILIKLSNFKKCHEDSWGNAGINLKFQTSALNGLWSTSRQRRFNPWEPCTHFIESFVGSKATLDAVENRKSPVSIGNRTLAIQSVARRNTDWAFPAFGSLSIN